MIDALTTGQLLYALLVLATLAVLATRYIVRAVMRWALSPRRIVPTTRDRALAGMQYTRAKDAA